jgi:hypothetical protein
MRPLLGALFLACAIIFVACGGDTGSGEQPTATTIDFAAEARRLVVDAVFIAEDLPGHELTGDDGLPSQTSLSDECDIFDPDVVFPDAVATADSGAYESALDDQIFTLAGVYRSDDEAAAALAATSDFIGRCEDEFENAVEQLARDFLAGFGIDLGPFSTIDVAIIGFDPTAVGDEIVGYRMHVNVNLIVTSRQYNLDAVVVREGSVVGVLIYGRFGEPDDGVEAELLRLMAGKLSAVNASLPE